MKLMDNMNFFDLFCELSKLPYNELSCEIMSHALSLAHHYDLQNYFEYVDQCDAWRYFKSSDPFNDSKAFLLVPPYKDANGSDFLTGDFKVPHGKNDSHLFIP